MYKKLEAIFKMSSQYLSNDKYRNLQSHLPEIILTNILHYRQSFLFIPIRTLYQDNETIKNVRLNSFFYTWNDNLPCFEVAMDVC